MSLLLQLYYNVITALKLHLSVSIWHFETWQLFCIYCTGLGAKMAPRYYTDFPVCAIVTKSGSVTFLAVRKLTGKKFPNNFLLILPEWHVQKTATFLVVSFVALQCLVQQNNLFHQTVKAASWFLILHLLCIFSLEAKLVIPRSPCCYYQVIHSFRCIKLINQWLSCRSIPSHPP